MQQRESALVDDGYLRVSLLVHLPEVLAGLGADSDTVIREAGFDPALFTDPENTILFTEVGRLLAHCARRTGCPHLGLLIGQKSQRAALGIVGLLVQSSPDVGTALRNLVQYLHLHDRGAVPSLQQAGRSAILAYGIYEQNVPGCEHIYAGSMAHADKIMQGLCGPGWRATEVQLPFRKPASVEPFRRVFRAPVRFDADVCALVFPARLLSQRVAGGDAAVHKSVEALVRALEHRSRGGTITQARRALRALLMAGRVSEHALAAAFAVHRRTLNRRLQSEGTSFRTLLDEARFEAARQLLRDSDARIDMIASSLGYSGASTFGRAFKRWSGSAPQVWRQRPAGT